MMGFLEAHQILESFAGGKSLSFLLATSAATAQLDLYLRATAAKRGFAAKPRTLLFGTLGQHLLAEPGSEEREVFLLLPWDFAAELDWRSGLPRQAVDPAQLRERAQTTWLRLQQRGGARYIYLPAALPPLFPNPKETDSLSSWLTSLTASLGAVLLPGEAFSLSTYLGSGCPIGSRWLAKVAEAIIEQATTPRAEACKVLVTDLDNVLWAGGIAEDGPEGISYGPEDAGYKHFLYQSLLSKLRQEGVLLAVVSRNDPEVALAPLRKGEMLLKEADFVGTVCSYQAKSAQIRSLAEHLNLALSSFVFVDDNPVELAEVSTQLPEVHCLAFPEQDDSLPDFFQAVAPLFAREQVTPEDRERTELYRRRLEGMVPSELKGSDLTEFLRDLQMRLTITDRTQGDRTRAVQLINKTNQFNLNGRRLSDAEVGAALAAGGRLYCASLADRTGSHGEILACLISAEGVMRSWVMSCRVFQRHVEHAFLAWLAENGLAPTHLEFVPTPRNEPLRQFLEDASFAVNPGGRLSFDAARFLAAHKKDLDLFDLKVS